MIVRTGGGFPGTRSGTIEVGQQHGMLGIGSTACRCPPPLRAVLAHASRGIGSISLLRLLLGKRLAGTFMQCIRRTTCALVSNSSPLAQRPPVEKTVPRSE